MDALLKRVQRVFNNPKYYIESVIFIAEKILIKAGLKKAKKFKIVIFDDLFPHPISGFRFTEFLYYLKNFPDLHIYCTGSAITSVHDSKSIRQILKEFKSEYPQYAGQVSLYNPHRSINAELGYVIFLDNVFNFLNVFEKRKLPFVFTLYPGGGLRLNDTSVNERLRKVFSSKLFRHVVVTQRNVLSLVTDQFNISEGQVSFIFGAVLPTNVYSERDVKPNIAQKETLDVCFIANKQMKGGIDKGFDLFAETAKLFENNSSVKFHVVGPYSDSDHYLGKLGNVTYYGMLRTIDLVKFFSKMDIVLSPNRPFVLLPGAFDGFPTAACTEASLCGVAMFVTDPLALNLHYTDDEDIVIIEPSILSIQKKIDYYLSNPGLLKKLSEKGRAHTQFIYSVENQLETRKRILLSQIYND